MGYSRITYNLTFHDAYGNMGLSDKKTKMTKTDELKEFVKYQGREDAVLKDRVEKKYQADLVKDVLLQEVSNSKLLNELFGEYSRQVATKV